jgi:hypothetical protein
MAAQPKSASSRLPSVHGANLEGPIRVELTHFHAVGEWPLFAHSGRPESTSSGRYVAFPMIPTILAGTERHSSDHRKQGAGARASSNLFFRERCSLPPCAATRLRGPLRRSPT